MSEIKITDEKENHLFKRKEIKATLSVEKSPSREEISEMLSKKYSVPTNHVKIKNIHGKFGSKIFTLEANVYSSKENKDFLEVKKKKENKSVEAAA